MFKMYLTVADLCCYFIDGPGALKTYMAEQP